MKQASAAETNVNIITTIDHNPASGIARISREIMADIIMLGWPRKAGLIDRLIGEKVDNILNSTDKCTFICHVERPLILHKRIVVIAPPSAEHEYGFEQWLIKVSKLAQELSAPVQFYCNTHTEKMILKAVKRLKLTISINISMFDAWDDFLVLSRELRNDDLLILISARKGAASYMNVLDGLPVKIEKYFNDNSRIVIYPQQFNQNNKIERFEDITAEPLSKSIETIQKIGKGIGNIFKKD